MKYLLLIALVLVGCTHQTAAERCAGFHGYMDTMTNGHQACHLPNFKKLHPRGNDHGSEQIPC